MVAPKLSTQPEETMELLLVSYTTQQLILHVNKKDDGSHLKLLLWQIILHRYQKYFSQ